MRVKVKTVIIVAWASLIVVLCAELARSQTTINGARTVTSGLTVQGTTTASGDLTGTGTVTLEGTTKTVNFEASLPATCTAPSGSTPGELVFRTSDNTLHACTATNTFTQIGGGGGGSANRIKDGLAVEYDPTPSSPNTEDDEFNSSTLDAKWTEITNTAAADDIDTTWQSHLYVRFSGDQSYVIDQDYAPAGDFSLTARFTYPIYTNFQQVQLKACDDDYSDCMHTAWAAVNNGCQGEIFSTDSGSGTLRGSVVRACVDKVYIHIQRTGTSWLGAFSFDGLGWYRIATHTKSVTIAHIRLALIQAGTTTPALAGCDWIRRDWLTLQ